jgi:cyanophycinase
MAGDGISPQDDPAGSLVSTFSGRRARGACPLGAVAHNPGVLGIGIEENSAAIFENGRLTVMGENAVCVVDGSTATYTNIAEEAEDRALSTFGVRLHVLSHGDRFELASREAEALTAVA